MNRKSALLSASLALLLPLLRSHADDDGNTGTPPPSSVTTARHVAATSGVHDPRTSYTHLPVMSGRPVNDTPIIICSWSGCDVLQWNYPNASLTVSLAGADENGEAGGSGGTSPVPPPILPNGVWSLYEDVGGPAIFAQWLADSGLLLGLGPEAALPGADSDADGQIHSTENGLHMHPFDHRVGFAIDPLWLITPTDPPCLTIEFAGLSGHIYGLEWTTDVTSNGSWQQVHEPFFTPTDHDLGDNIGANRFFVYAYTVNLPPAMNGLSRYFLRMVHYSTEPQNMVLPGSGGGAAAAQMILIPPPDEHELPTSTLQSGRRLAGRFANPRPGTEASIAFNEHYIAGGLTLNYRPLRLPPDFDLNDPLRVFDVVFRSLSNQVRIFPSENYYYWSLRIGRPDEAGMRHFRGNINLSARSRDGGVLGFYYAELIDMFTGNGTRRFQLANGRTFGPPSLTVARGAGAPPHFQVTRSGRTVEFFLPQTRQAPYPAGVLRGTERIVERTIDESGLQFLLVYQPPQPPGQTTGTFVWLLDPGPYEAPFTSPLPADFAPVPGLVGTFRHTRTGFVFSTDTPVVSAARRYVLVAVAEEHVIRNTWFDGPADQLEDNFEGPDAIRDLMVEALRLNPADIDRFGYFTGTSGTERVGLYVYGGYRNDADLAAFVRTVRPDPALDVNTGALWNSTILGASAVAVVPQGIVLDNRPLPANVALGLAGAERNRTSGQLGVQTDENYETPVFPNVWMTKSQKGTAVCLRAPNAGAAMIVGEYRTAPQSVLAQGPPVYPWRDGFSPGPTSVAVDPFGECWIANTGDNRLINGVEMGSVARIGIALGGTRCNADGSPNPDGEYLKPPFDYLSPSVRDRDGDGLLHTSRGLGDVLGWPGTADAIRLDGRVPGAIDELICNYVRVHARGVRALALRDDQTLWAGGAVNSAYVGLDPTTGNLLNRPFDLPGGEMAMADEQPFLWTMGRGRVSRHRFGSALPNIPVFVETLPAALGLAAARASAIGFPRGPAGTAGGGRVWIGSGDETAAANELSLYNAQAAAMSRLLLIDPAGQPSRGVVALAEMSKPDSTSFGPVFASEQSLSILAPTPIEPALAGSFWNARATAGPVTRHEVPRNPDVPGPFNRGLAGISQGRGRSMWFADALGHRAVQVNAAGNVQQMLPLYTPADVAQARNDAAAGGTPDPFHLLAGPWTQGDMTGMNRLQRGNCGLALFTHDSQHPRRHWTRVTCTGAGLTQESLRLAVRAMESPLGFTSPIREVRNGTDFSAAKITGRYLQVYIRLCQPPAAVSSPQIGGILLE